MKFLTRKGYLMQEQGMTYLADTDPDLALASLRAAACTYGHYARPSGGPESTELANRSCSAAHPGALCQGAGL